MCRARLPIPGSLAKRHSEAFATFDDGSQTQLFNNLGLACCALALKRSGRNQNYAECASCDCGVSNGVMILAPEEADAIMQAFSATLKQTRTCKSKHSRAAMMNALCRILKHAPSSENFDLAASQIGQYCLASLRSSVRELRIGAR